MLLTLSLTEFTVHSKCQNDFSFHVFVSLKSTCWNYLDCYMICNWQANQSMPCGYAASVVIFSQFRIKNSLMFLYLWTNQIGCVVIQSMAGNLASQIASDQRKWTKLKVGLYIPSIRLIIFSEMLSITKSVEYLYKQTRWKMQRGREQNNLESYPRENIWRPFCLD